MLQPMFPNSISVHVESVVLEARETREKEDGESCLPAMHFSVQATGMAIELNTGEIFCAPNDRRLYDHSKRELRRPLELRLSLYCKQPTSTDERFGMINYYPSLDTEDGNHPSGLKIWVNVSPNFFSPLWAMAARGILPAGFSIEVQGMEHDDGTSRRLEWNVETARSLPIVSIKYYTPPFTRPGSEKTELD
jgi:hypothetical protein